MDRNLKEDNLTDHDRRDSFYVAVASTDGIVVNSHFGRASSFYIYDVKDDGDTSLVEKRQLEPVCAGGTHDDDRMAKNLESLSDCRFLLAARVGPGAQRHAERFGITAVEEAGMIDELLPKIIKYKKLQELIYR